MNPRPDRPSSPVPTEATGLPERLAAVLGDLVYPAQRWQVLTTAELYGVDTVTRGLLDRLPERRYHSLVEVAGVLLAVLTGRGPAPTGPAGVTRAARTASRRGPAGAPAATPTVTRPTTPTTATPAAATAALRAARARAAGRAPLPATPVA